MDVREKLVELMKEVKYSVFPNSTDHYTFGIQHNDHIFRQVADHLIAHGVTVQEWISVKDRLPEKPMKCLVYTKRGGYGGYEITHYNEGFYLQYENVTHWMTLPDEPQPPKGE